MKNSLFVILILLFLSPLVGNSQSKSDKLYEIFDNKPGVINFSFSKNMLDVVNLDISDDGKGESKVTGDLHEIRFLSYNPKKGQLTGNEFIEKAIGYLPKSAYKEYEDDDYDDTRIFLQGGKKNFKECHLFVGNNAENNLRFVVSFYGNFKVEDLDGLTTIGINMSDKDED